MKMMACPFCNSPHTTLMDDPFHIGDDDCWVECDNCEAFGPSKKGQAAAIEAWNSRAREKELEKQLREAIDVIIDIGGYKWVQETHPEIWRDLMESGGTDSTPRL